jgi:hypothetical protein
MCQAVTFRVHDKAFCYNVDMMSYLWGGGAGWGMMGDAGLVGTIIWLVVVIDLVLVGVWLWQQVTKK